MRTFFILLASLLLLGGCINAPKNKGGYMTVTRERWVFDNQTIEAPNLDAMIPEIGSSPIVHEITEITVAQPENPKEDSKIEFSIDKHNNPVITTKVGGSVDISAAVDFVQSTKFLQYVGVGLILLGIGIMAFARFIGGRLILWPAAISLAGLLLAITASLLIKYPAIFLAVVIGIILLGIGFVCYYIYKYIKTDKATTENVAIIQYLKDKYLSENDKLKEFKSQEGIAAKKQSKSTKKIVNKIKKEKII